MSEPFERHVANFLVPFAKQALESLLVQGFCAYSIKPPRAEKTDFAVPFVFSRASYETVLTVERGEDKLRCRGARDQKTGKLNLFTFDSPDIDGTLTSRAAVVSQTISYLEEIEKHDIQSFAIRSRPPVLTTTKTDHAFDSRNVIGGAIEGLAAQDASDNMTTRNAINIDQYKQQADLIKTLNIQQIDSSEVFWKRHTDPTKNTYLSESIREGVDGYVPRFIPLPNDADVAKMDFATERKDYVQLQKLCKMHICTGLGVPEGFIDGQSTGGNSVASARNMDEFVRISLMPLRSALSRLLLEVFENCYGNSLEVECIFPGTQNIDKLMEWYSCGLLKQEAIVQALAYQENIKREDFVDFDVSSPANAKAVSLRRNRDESGAAANNTDEKRQRKRWSTPSNLSVFT
jgi:hypothetical protein